MQAWENFLRSLEQSLGPETFSKWVRPLKVVHFDACNLYLEAENSFQIEWFEEHVRSRAKLELINNNSHPIKIHITCTEIGIKEKKAKKATENTPPAPFAFVKDFLQEEMSFENFIFNSKDHILRSLMTQVTREEKTAPDFNPLFFHGPSCCGKTHLLQALAQQLQKKQIRALYVKAETFTENVIQAIRTSNMEEFRKKHRNVDVLIFDNVQYLEKKAATQEEFFHTFNALHSERKQIVLSADVTPSLLQDIEPRLVSRFEWGLVLPIHKLEDKELLQMLKIRANNLSFPVSESILKLLIESFPSSIKSLHQSLEALILRSNKIPSHTLSVPIAKGILSDLIELEQKEVLTPEKIVSSVANFFSVTKEEILSKSQTQECALPRQIAMFLCRNELKMPFTRIGEYFKRDHSTVISSVRNIEEKTKLQDKETGFALASIKQKIL